MIKNIIKFAPLFLLLLVVGCNGQTDTTELVCTLEARSGVTVQLINKNTGDPIPICGFTIVS